MITCLPLDSFPEFPVPARPRLLFLFVCPLSSEGQAKRLAAVPRTQ